MEVTHSSIARSCSAATTAKAERLDVIMLTRTMAIVAGDHDDYIVWLDTLECSCKAGQVGRLCSHAIAAQAARPKRRYARYDAATGDFAVVENGTVVAHVRSYLQAEAAHG
jgi:predicted nucleic acid-binding Zn finger protein